MSNVFGAALNVNNYNYLTDHLAPIAAVMGCPVILTAEDSVQLSKEWYPGVDFVLQDWDTINPAYYAMHYDVLFQSELFPLEKFRETFQPFEAKRKSPMRNVHVPHGFSDKGFWFEKVVKEDITLVYGQNMLDLLKKFNVLDQLGPHVITGNYRYTYYKMHRELLDKKLKEKVLSKFKKKARRTILYAPTWNDMEKSTSFFSVGPHLVENLSSEDHLIVKLHPNLETENPAEVYAFLGKYEKHPNVLILENFSQVYPLLAVSDIYIGDMSSVGYDYLAFNRPMFFLNERKRDQLKDRGLYLYKCGVEIKPEEYHNLYKIIEENLPHDKERFQSIRKEVYEYTFGQERSFEAIKNDVVKVIQES